MRSQRLSSLLVLPGIMLGIATVLGITVVNASYQPSTPVGLQPNVLAESLVDSQVFVPPASPSTMSAFRFTYEPGTTFDATFPGPVVLHIESGKMAITHGKETSIGYQYAGVGSASSEGVPLSDWPNLKTNAQGETILVEGWTITIEDGQLGQTRNAGKDQLNVLAVLLIPQPLYTSAGEHETTNVRASQGRDRGTRRQRQQAEISATPVIIGP